MGWGQNQLHHERHQVAIPLALENGQFESGNDCAVSLVESVVAQTRTIIRQIVARTVGDEPTQKFGAKGVVRRPILPLAARQQHSEYIFRDSGRELGAELTAQVCHRHLSCHRPRAKPFFLC
jgi:hypothetical protein